jgi:cytosine deaminase
MSGPRRDALDRELAQRMLRVAYDEAVIGLSEGGIPIGAAMFTRAGELLAGGRNRRVQDDDASVHAETDAFRRAGRRTDYSDCVMATTLSPCWYCAGLVRQFRIGALVVGEDQNFTGAHAWLTEAGVDVVLLEDRKCTELLADFIGRRPELWREDIGET